MQNSGSTPTHHQAVGAVDLFIAIRRHALKALVISALIAACGFAYYRMQPEEHRVEIVMDVSNYEILYSPRLALQIEQHQRLAKDKRLLKVVSQALIEEGFLNDIGELPAGFIGAKDLGKKHDYVMVSAKLPSREAAERAMELWRESYMEVVPVYRANRMLNEYRGLVVKHTRDEMEAEALLAGLKDQLALPRSDDPDDAFREEGLRQKIIELEGNKALHQHYKRFAEKVLSLLQDVVDGSPLPSSGTDEWGESKPESIAYVLMAKGKEQLMSDTVYEKVDSGAGAKVSSMFLTSFFLLITLFVFVDLGRATPASCGC